MKRKYAILGACGHLIIEDWSRKAAEKKFAKQFDIIKYPVKLYR